MPKLFSLTIVAPLVAAAAAMALGACSTTTYGTGTSAARQTFDDLTGILALGGTRSDEEPIDYSPRAPIVVPPATTLPPPGSEAALAAANDWPVDPDEEKKRIDALVKERAESGESLKFTLPETGRQRTTLANSRDPDSSRHDEVRRERMRNQSDPEAKKLYASAKASKTGSFDEAGAPVRRYLTEPPVVYREPDPESPVEITEKPKPKRKFKWPDLWPF